jgi:D-3-phosphoglycerate dehydrogenase
MKIIVTEKISEKGMQVLQESGAQVDLKLKMPREELLEVIGGYDAIIVRSATKVNEELFENGKQLKVVGRAGNGVDNIDMPSATKHGVIVVNTPDANSVSAAEHTIGLMLAASRKSPQANAAMKNRIWDRSPYTGVELYGKTLGIVGLGRIGALVSTRLQAFDMRVIAYDPYIADSRFEKFGVEKKETLAELMQEADFVTIHTPKTKETLGMIGKEEFALAKKGLQIVNCARGGLIDEEAIAWAVAEGIVAGGGIDVLNDEPETTSPLFDLEHIIQTPHIGADTLEAQDNVGVSIAHEVLSALRGEMVPNAVNMPTLQHQELDRVKHSLQLGEILGKFYYQLNREPVERVEVVYSGDTAKMETSVITLAVLKGLMEPVIQEKVNYVNAGLLAKNRGIEVVESRMTENEHYLNFIQLRVHSKDSTFTIGGTVFGKKELRIAEVNGFMFDVIPTPYMLIAENIDQPGMIGKIGTMLGQNNINIATMQVSRNVQGQKAMMFLTIDSEPTNGDLDNIATVDGIQKIQFVRL